MKKKYIKPTIQVVHVNVTNLLTASSFDMKYGDQDDFIVDDDNLVY